MSENPIILFHGWSDQAASFDRLAGIMRKKLRDGCCKFLCAKRIALSAKEEYLSYGQELKQRRVGDSGHREVILSKAEVLKEFIFHQAMLIEVVLKRLMVDLVLVRNGRNA